MASTKPVTMGSVEDSPVKLADAVERVIAKVTEEKASVEEKEKELTGCLDKHAEESLAKIAEALGKVSDKIIKPIQDMLHAAKDDIIAPLDAATQTMNQQIADVVHEVKQGFIDNGNGKTEKEDVHSDIDMDFAEEEEDAGENGADENYVDDESDDDASYQPTQTVTKTIKASAKDSSKGKNKVIKTVSKKRSAGKPKGAAPKRSAAAKPLAKNTKATEKDTGNSK